MNFQMFKLDLEKAEEPEIKLPESVGSSKARELQIYFCFVDYAKAFDCVDHKKLQRANVLEKTLMLGNTEGKRREQQRMRWLDGIPD